MTTNVREFNLELEQFLGRQLPTMAQQAHKKITMDVLAGVVRKSPVDTGRFRGNWQVGVEAAPVVELDRKDPQPYGSEPGTDVINSAQAAVGAIRPYGVSFVVNNLPYAERLENGWSKQAPSGMVALTLQEIADRIVEELGPA